MRAQGSTALITGASSGIGAATAIELGRRGARVGLLARREQRLREVAAAVEGAGGEALVLVADVRDAEALREAVRLTSERFGGIDVLVNNAGYGLSLTVAQTTEEQMRDLFEVNYMGAFVATRAVLPLMLANRRGQVVFVSSTVGKISFPYHGAYAATKSALISLAQALRSEAAGSGVSVSVVLPANTRSEFFEVQSRLSGRGSGPLGPAQSPETVGRAIVRSIEKPTPEVNLVPPLRLAYGLDALFPRLRDLAGRWFYAYRSRRER